MVQPGTMVGEYRVERVIGEGAFGRVYRAVHPVIGKAAAVKVLDWQFSSKQEWVSRFVSEARAVNQIRHRNIVDIFSFGQLPDGRAYFVMELLEGETLRDRLEKKGPLPVNQALPILEKTARALDAAHAAGIAHRDLKPDNLFLSYDEDGTCFPKLLDFGIAKLMGGDHGPSGHRTATGAQIGTPLYMSPEQCRGHDVDQRTDIYALGTMVHETLTGRTPFDDGSMVDLMIAHMSHQPPPMSAHNPRLPKALDAPVLHMLQKDPALRPQTAGAAVRELVRAAGDGGLSATDPRGPLLPALADTVLSDALPSEMGETAGQGTGAWLSEQGYPTPPTAHAEPGARRLPAGPGPNAMTAPGASYPIQPPVTRPTGPPSSLLPYLLGGGALFAVVLAGIVATAVALSGDDDEPAPRPVDTSAPDPSEGAAQMTARIAAPGTRVDNQSTLGMTFKLTQPGRGLVESVYNTTTRRTVVVLASDQSRVTEVRVTYAENSESLTATARPPEHKPGAVTGNTYVVSSNGTELSIRSNTGNIVSATEQKEIKSDMAGMFQPPVLAKVLGGRTLRLGESVLLDPQQAVQLLGEPDEGTRFEVDRASLTVRAIRIAAGMRLVDFDTAIVFSIERGDQTIKSTVSGTLTVRAADCWPQLFDIKGPLTVSRGPATDLGAGTTGQLVHVASATYGAGGM